MYSAKTSHREFSLHVRNVCFVRGRVQVCNVGEVQLRHELITCR